MAQPSAGLSRQEIVAPKFSVALKSALPYVHQEALEI